MRRPLIRWPLTLLLVWLAWLGMSQALSELGSDEDWSDAYHRAEAVIVDSREELSTMPGSRTTSYFCELIVEWRFEGEAFRSEPLWLHGPRSRSSMGEDCGRARYGETVPIWIDASTADPVLLQPGNRSAQPLTIMFNLVQSAVFLGLAALLWRPRRSSGATESSEVDD